MPVPSNDNVANSLLITFGSSVAVDTTDATVEPDSPLDDIGLGLSYTAPSVWYKFYAQETGQYRISGSSVSDKPYVEAFTDDTTPTINTLVRVDPGGYWGDGTTSPVDYTFTATAGQWIYLYASDYVYLSTGAVAFTFSVSHIVTPVPGCGMRNRWRYVLTDLNSAPIAVWETQVSNRSIEYTLNQPTVIRGTIHSDNKLANLTHTDGFPYLTEGDRLLYAFRRDYNGVYQGTWSPWQCRAAGLIMEVHDTGDPDAAVTEFVAYDPWQYLYSLPLVNPTDLPGNEGNTDYEYADTPLHEIVQDLIFQAESAYTFANPYKTGIDYLSGTLEFLPNVTHTFQKETSIGQCLEECVALGCDIVLTPVYDPVTRPGAMVILNVYASAGDDQPDSVFGWDKGRRSLVSDDRSIDGTLRANRIRYHGSPTANNDAQTETRSNLASVARFGDYYTSRFFPDVADWQTDDKLLEEAEQLIAEVGEGKRTVVLGPAPERAPNPFIEYSPWGDSVKVFASKRLRATQSGYQRITGFTVELSDDALETIRDVRVYIPESTGS